MISFIKDKVAFVVSGFFCLLVILYAYGCEPKTRSLIDPSVSVTRLELVDELDKLQMFYDRRIADLEKKEAFKKFVFEASLDIAEKGEINPLGIITSLLAVLGVGATADDIRLRKDRKKTTTYEPVSPA